jgi:hypothetical protein
MRNAQLLVLDELAEALDPLDEYALFQHFSKLIKVKMDATNLNTFPTYSGAHAAPRLQLAGRTWGDSLDRHGMQSRNYPTLAIHTHRSLRDLQQKTSPSAQD